MTVFFWKSRDARPRGVGAASPLLEYIAGEFAARIATVWSDPHTAFLTAPAPRRHLLCLAFACAEGEQGIDADAILGRPMKRAIRIAAPTAPDGLARALGRLGERAWSRADYLRLIGLLAGRQSAKLLRHRDQIAADEVRALNCLPPGLLDRGLGRLSLSEPAAGLVAEAFVAITRRDGEAVAQALATRWSVAENLKGLVELVQHDLEPEVVAPPFPGTERLRPLLTKAALIDAAQRFKNCLRNHVRWACSGTSAYYEWMEPPGAVLEITRDRLHGWALDQARLTGNKAVPEPTRTAIVEELKSLGGYVGRPLWQLDSSLDDIARVPPEAVKTQAEVIGELFGD